MRKVLSKPIVNGSDSVRINSIAHVSFSGDFGGRENVALQLFRGMQQGSYRCFLYLVVEKRAGKIRNEHLLSAVGEKEKEVRFFNTYDRFSFPLLQKLAKQLLEDKVEVAHCHCYKSLCYLLLARFFRLWRGAVCFTLHGLILGGGARANAIRLGQSIGIRLVDGIIGCSREVLENSVPSNCRQEQKIIINGIDIAVKSYDEIKDIKEKARAALVSRFGLRNEAFIIINVGRLTPQKNFSLFLQLIEHRLLHEENDECAYLVVGNGELRDSLIAEAQSRLVDNRVVFTGFVQDMERLYLGADLLVQTSVWEGTPMCLLEARSYGLPAIVPDVGGNSDVLTNNKDGFLFPNGDLLQLADNLKKYLVHRELCDKHGQVAFHDIVARFGLARSAEKHLAFYTLLHQKCIGRN